MKYSGLLNIGKSLQLTSVLCNTVRGQVCKWYLEGDARIIEEYIILKDQL